MPLPNLTPQQNATRTRVVAAVLAAIALGGAGAGLDKLTDVEEGNRTTAYRDMGGRWTICKGIAHDVKPGEVRTEQQCLAANSAEEKKWLQVATKGFNQPQPDARIVAFADLAYNVGERAFMHSTARKLVNAGDTAGGCRQLLRWVYVGGRVIPWQVQRRAIEFDLCIHGLPQ